MTSATETYRILGPLAKGGMAEILLAQRSSDGRRVVIKRMPPEVRNNTLFSQHFMDEIALNKTLSHPRVPSMLDHGEDEEGPKSFNTPSSLLEVPAY